MMRPAVSWQARLAAWVLRHRVKPRLGDFRDLDRIRAVFGTRMPSPRGMRYRSDSLGAVPGEWVEAASVQAPRATLLYLHGGGFVGCSPRTHRPLTAALARRGFRVYVPAYRLAPEHPFPAAPDDVQRVWQALRAAVPGRLVVAGESAGGNLALGLALALRDSGQALPDALALFSPALDLSGGSASFTLNAERDAMFRGDCLANLRDFYLAGADPAELRASPLLAPLQGLPPMLVHAGDDEALRDDSIRLADKARAAGVTVQSRLFPGVPHAWQLISWLPETRLSLDAAAAFLHQARAGQAVEHHDAVIVGAGLSGIGQAAQLLARCPGKSFTVLEARGALGGTWDLFRYPGVRSDSDMFTLGYGWRPWGGPQAIAEGGTIRRYLEDTAASQGIDLRIRTRHRVVEAAWSSADARWHLQVEVQRADAPLQRIAMSCSLLLSCAGYYRYDRGHRPAFAGEQDFLGQVVHPQLWPEGLDCRGRRVVVIGSGATAVTLVPTLVQAGAQVTMLQRTPTYVFALPAADPLARALSPWLPWRLVHALVRGRNIVLQWAMYKLARRRPDAARRRILAQTTDLLRERADLVPHFSPDYKPWDQRICAVPDADLFRVLRQGKAEVVTDRLLNFTPSGLRLASGRELPADIVVTATGLELNSLGDMRVSVDGQPFEPARQMTYKGLMLSGLPNLVYTFGYTNASWTLKADLAARWTCRLIHRMDQLGAHTVRVERDAAVGERPLVDFTSGYFLRALDRLPRQGDRPPWAVNQDYFRDWWALRVKPVDDGVLRFETPA
jgi:monooxygenase